MRRMQAMDAFIIGIAGMSICIAVASKDTRDIDVNAADTSNDDPVYLVEMTKHIKVTRGARHLLLIAASC